MSLATWRKKFYPVAAHRALGSEEAALKHSIRKWKGLNAEALAEHGLTRIKPSCGPPKIQEDECNWLAIDGETCALCVRHHEYLHPNGHKPPAPGGCEVCVLTHMRGSPCDTEREWELRSPFRAWGDFGDPEPMLMLLREALLYPEKKKRRRKKKSPTKKKTKKGKK